MPTANARYDAGSARSRLATSKDKLEERFRNIEIRQDGPLGLVTFDYDCVINDKVHHSGLEVWQVGKVDGQWKIVSVAWTID